MKKQILLTVAASIALGLSSFAQCTPDPNNTSDLLYPTPANANYSLVKNQAFDETVTVNLPSDTSATFPVVGARDAFIDSLKITSVQGLPPGLASACNNAECLILGGQQGCVRLFGTPTQAGTFKITISATMFVREKALNVPLPLPIEEEYDLVVDQENNVNLIHKNGTLNVYPNPAKNSVFVENRDYTGEYSIQIFNVMGLEVANFVRAQKLTEISTDLLSNGMYILKITTSTNQSSTRLLISK